MPLSIGLSQPVRTHRVIVRPAYALVVGLLIPGALSLADGGSISSRALLGHRCLVVVDPGRTKVSVVTLHCDDRTVGVRKTSPFVFLVAGQDLGEGEHLLKVTARTGKRLHKFGSLPVLVDRKCLAVSRSLCLLFQGVTATPTPSVSDLVPALERSPEPLRVLQAACAQLRGRRGFEGARRLLQHELEAWGGAVLTVAQRLEQTKLWRAVELVSAFTDVGLDTSLTPKALQLLGRLCDDYGDYEGAIAACKRLLEECPNQRFLLGDALLRMGYCLDHNGQHEEGMRALERVATEYGQTNPRAAAIAKADLAFIRQSRDGDRENAIRLTGEALAALPEGDPARITLQARVAMYYHGLGQLERALEEYRKVPPGRGSDPSSNYDCRVFVPSGRADVLKKLGRTEEAKKVLEEAMERYKDDEWVVRRLRLELNRYTNKGWLGQE